MAQLEAEIALHKKCNQEIKTAQDGNHIHHHSNVFYEGGAPIINSTELNEFVIQLDEEVDAMQATILSLQQQIKDDVTSPRDSIATAMATTEQDITPATASVTKTTSSHGNSSNHGNKERTSRYNGPLLETVAMATSSGSSSASKSVNNVRSSDS